MKRLFFISLLCIFTLWGCTGDCTPQITNTAESVVSSPVDASGLFSDRDYKTEYSIDTTITLSGSTAVCTGSGATVDGSTVTIAKEGTYHISGTLEDGMIIVDTDKQSKVQLVLDGASIHSAACASIYVRQADKVFITLAQGSENALSNGGSFAAADESSIDAVIFSKEDLTLNGSGKLTVSSPAGHGIVSKDELTITGGSYTIETASHGISGKDNVCIADGTLQIVSGRDGIRAEHDEDTALGFVYISGGSFTVKAAGDAISASSSLTVDGGSFDILTGGGSVNAEAHTWENPGNMGGHPGQIVSGRPGGMGGGMMPGTAAGEAKDGTSSKALKATSALVINGGSFAIDAADDALHSNGSLSVNGGGFAISTGDDALHADAALTVTSGSIHITESYEGLEGLNITLSGGDITLTASDDGLNAAGGVDSSGFGGHRGGDMFASDPDSRITISGGTLFVSAAGDGIDSNGDLTVTGGHTVVEGPTDGANGPLDYAGCASISGGTLIVTGSMQMAQSIASDGQGVLGISVGSQRGGTAWELRDANAEVVLSGQPEKAYSCLVISCPQMVTGQVYTITVGSLSGELKAD